MSILRAVFVTSQITEPKPMDITLDGHHLGTVEPSRISKDGRWLWHAAFKPIGGDTSALTQGFGDTPEEAIADAFVSKREELERALALVEELKAAMYSEPGEESA